VGRAVSPVPAEFAYPITPSVNAGNSFVRTDRIYAGTLGTGTAQQENPQNFFPKTLPVSASHVRRGAVRTEHLLTAWFFDLPFFIFNERAGGLDLGLRILRCLKLETWHRARQRPFDAVDDGTDLLLGGSGRIPQISDGPRLNRRNLLERV
jgi:hypothetical protein